MKSWSMVVPAVVLMIGLAWVLQGERRQQAETVLGVAETREARSRAEPPHQSAERRAELAPRQAQRAAGVEQQAYRPPPHRPAPAGQSQPPAEARAAREQASGDAAPARLTLDAQEQERQERERIEQIVAHLDDTFHRESDDGGWAVPMEAGLAEDFQADDWQENALAEASCRSRLCRIVVAHADSDAASAFVARMGTLHAFVNTEGFYQQVTLADGTSATVVYLAREGYRLPAIPSP